MSIHSFYRHQRTIFLTLGMVGFLFLGRHACSLYAGKMMPNAKAAQASPQESELIDPVIVQHLV